MTSLNDFFFLSIFVAIVLGYIFFAYKLIKGEIKWNREINADPYVPPKSIFDSQNTFDNINADKQRAFDAINVSHGHPPGVPYIRT